MKTTRYLLKLLAQRLAHTQVLLKSKPQNYIRTGRKRDKGRRKEDKTQKPNKI